MQSTTMRSTANALLILGAADVAGAHRLSTTETVAEQLHHQVFALHHLPMNVLLTTLLVVGGLLLTRQATKKPIYRRPRRHRKQQNGA